MEKSHEQLSFVDARGWLVRVALGIVAVLAVVGGYYSTRWQFGQMMAESYSPGMDNAAMTAVLAVSLSPQNSYAHSISAKIQQGKMLSEILAKTERDNENAVRYSPNDYRYWVELGRTREQTGDREQGEAAMRRAVELAPNYAYPRWMLGNLLLRAGRRDEAFAEFKQVAATHTVLRQQVFYLVWEFSGGDAELIKQQFGDTPAVRAALATFYAGKSRPEESVAVWQTLSADEKAEHRNAAFNAMRLNYEKLNLHAAVFFMRDLQNEMAEIGRITNAGFEDEIAKPKEAVFGWQVEQIKGVDTALDLRQPREGKRSLRLTFSNYQEPTLHAAAQIVAVEPNTKYRLSFAVRTADLKSAGMPFLQVMDAKLAQTLGASDLFAAGTNNEWQPVAIEFIAPPDAQGVFLRTARAFCGANCPLVGTLWYDDFKLEKIEQTTKK